MVRHVVMLKWIDGVDAGHIEATRDALGAVVARLPEVSDYRLGPDLGLADGNFDYAIVAEFATVDDYMAYRDDPEHQRVVADYIKNHVTARAAVQYEVG